MAKITILTWNVEQFGKTRYKERTPFVTYFLSRIKPLPDIFVLIELKSTNVTQAHTIAKHLQEALNSNYEIKEAKIKYEFILSYYTDIEIYCVFYNPKVVEALTIKDVKEYGTNNYNTYFDYHTLEGGNDRFQFRKDYQILNNSNWNNAPSYEMQAITTSTTVQNKDFVNFFPLITYPGFRVTMKFYIDEPHQLGVAFFRVLNTNKIMAIMNWHNNAGSQQVHGLKEPFRNTNMKRHATANYIKNGFRINLGGNYFNVDKVIVTGDFNVDPYKVNDVYNKYQWNDGKQYKLLIDKKTHLMSEGEVAKEGENSFKNTESLCNLCIDNFICQPDISYDSYSTKVIDILNTFRYAKDEDRSKMLEIATKDILGRPYLKKSIKVMLTEIKDDYEEIEPSSFITAINYLKKIIGDTQYTTLKDISDALKDKIDDDIDLQDAATDIINLIDGIFNAIKKAHISMMKAKNSNNTPTFFASYFVIKTCVSDHLPIYCKITI